MEFSKGNLYKITYKAGNETKTDTVKFIGWWDGNRAELQETYTDDTQKDNQSNLLAFEHPRPYMTMKAKEGTRTKKLNMDGEHICNRITLKGASMKDYQYNCEYVEKEVKTMGFFRKNITEVEQISNVPRNHRTETKHQRPNARKKTINTQIAA